MGSAVAVVIGVVVLWLAVVWPGWQAVPFLTAEAEAVLPVFVASLCAGILVNAVNVIADSRIVRALGEIVTTVLSFFVALQLWIVFPFDFPADGIDWALLVRALLALAMVGCIAGVIAQLIALGRRAAAALGG